MFLSRIFTLYPEYFPGYLSKGLFGKAMNEKIWNLETVNIRNYSSDKHKTVDDTPYGGGNGMLIKADVLAKSLDENIMPKKKIKKVKKNGKGVGGKAPRIKSLLLRFSASISSGSSESDFV